MVRVALENDRGSVGHRSSSPAQSRESTKSPAHGHPSASRHDQGQPGLACRATLFAERWLVRESAGINRHGEGDGNALHRRPSESRWPRVMRWRPVRAQRSVDRGRAGGAIEPRNPKKNQGADAFLIGGRQYGRRRFRELLVGPARSENPGTHDELHAREPGDLVVARWWLMMPRPGWFAGWQISTGWAVRGTPVAVIPR